MIVDLNNLGAGTEIILNTIARNVTLTKLDMSNTSMTPGAFAALITILATNGTLRHLSVANNPKHMSGGLLIGLANVVKIAINPQLRSIDLSAVLADASMETAAYAAAPDVALHRGVL